MQTKRLLAVSTLSALLGAGCTAHIAPDVKKFSDSVNASATKVLEHYDERTYEQKYRDELNAAMVASNVTLMGRGCDGGPIAYSVSLDQEQLSDFSKHCELTQIIIDPAGDLRAPEPLIRAPSGGEGSQGYNARRLALALQRYSTALSDLATAETPAKLGTGFTAASNAVLGLVDAANAVSGSASPSAETSARRSATTDLLGSLLTEAFEARRYAMLKGTVKDANTTVMIASKTLAAWFYEDEKKDLEAPYEKLADAFKGAQKVKGMSPEQRQASLARVRSTYDDVVGAEEKAAWKTFFDIGKAHTAILESLNNPTDEKALMEANKRIGELAKKVDAFVKATEKN